METKLKINVGWAEVWSLNLCRVAFLRINQVPSTHILILFHFSISLPISICSSINQFPTSCPTVIGDTRNRGTPLHPSPASALVPTTVCLQFRVFIYLFPVAGFSSQRKRPSLPISPNLNSKRWIYPFMIFPPSNFSPYLLHSFYFSWFG